MEEEVEPELALSERERSEVAGFEDLDLVENLGVLIGFRVLNGNGVLGIGRDSVLERVREAVRFERLAVESAVGQVIEAVAMAE